MVPLEVTSALAEAELTMLSLVFLFSGITCPGGKGTVGR